MTSHYPWSRSEEFIFDTSSHGSLFLTIREVIEGKDCHQDDRARADSNNIEIVVLFTLTFQEDGALELLELSREFRTKSLLLQLVYFDLGLLDERVGDNL